MDQFMISESRVLQVSYQCQNIVQYVTDTDTAADGDRRLERNMKMRCEKLQVYYVDH
jgi:hypothetical protein